MSCSKRRGAIMLEAVMAMFIFSCAFLTLLVVLPGSGRALHKARVRVLATHVARQQLEDIIAQGYDGMSGCALTAAPTLLVRSGGTTETFTCSYAATVAAASSSLKRISCRVQWQDDSTWQNLTLDTMVTI